MGNSEFDVEQMRNTQLYIQNILTIINNKELFESLDEETRAGLMKVVTIFAKDTALTFEGLARSWERSRPDDEKKYGFSK